MLLFVALWFCFPIETPEHQLHPVKCDHFSFLQCVTLFLFLFLNVVIQESEDFSDYQLRKLMKQSKLTGRIETVRKEMNQRVTGDITYALGDDYYGEVVESQRVVSEDAAHIILIKGIAVVGLLL
jgi:hypothetical protein